VKRASAEGSLDQPADAIPDAVVRIHSINPTARVIMVTGSTDPARAGEALELGALAYVDKPFDFAYLKRVVAMALQQEPEKNSPRP